MNDEIEDKVEPATPPEPKTDSSAYEAKLAEWQNRKHPYDDPDVRDYYVGCYGGEG